MNTVLEEFKGKISPDSFTTFQEAWTRSDEVLRSAAAIVSASLSGCALDPNHICIAAVGSTARYEAMGASDLDLIPIWNGDPRDFPHFEDLGGKIREDLRRATGLDVSTSRDLMRSTELSTLRRADGIGGDQDHRRTLTQRMLILTESQHLGGNLDITKVRRDILEAYVGNREVERTVSKHPLAVCNDIARYYRTLCVDYKSRAETKPESWAERHAKLRNSRKLWYFSTLISLSKKIAHVDFGEDKRLFDALSDTFSAPPLIRLYSASDSNSLPYAICILDFYARYLSDMSRTDFRAALKDVHFEDREAVCLRNGNSNLYRDMLIRSRRMSEEMIKMMLHSEERVRQKVYNWFLL